MLPEPALLFDPAPRSESDFSSDSAPPRDWATLTDMQQLALSRAALHRASETIAGQAEILAGEIESGALDDRGGPDALRLLAALVRLPGRTDADPAGHA